MFVQSEWLVALSCLTRSPLKLPSPINHQSINRPAARRQPLHCFYLYWFRWQIFLNTKPLTTLCYFSFHGFIDCFAVNWTARLRRWSLLPFYAYVNSAVARNWTTEDDGEWYLHSLKTGSALALVLIPPEVSAICMLHIIYDAMIANQNTTWVITIYDFRNTGKWRRGFIKIFVFEFGWFTCRSKMVKLASSGEWRWDLKPLIYWRLRHHCSPQLA